MGWGGRSSTPKNIQLQIKAPMNMKTLGWGGAVGCWPRFRASNVRASPSVNVNPSVHTELAKGGLVLKATKDLARGRVCIWPEAACASGQRPPKLHPGGSVPLPLPPRHHCVWPKAAGLIWPKAARVSLIIHPAATCAFAILSQSSSDKPSANSRKNTPPMLTCFKRFASSSQSSSSRPAINHRFMRSLKQA